MKKILCFSMLLAGIAGASFKSVAAIHNNVLVDTVKKKIVHPKTPMSDDDLNSILNKMRHGKNDQDKITTLKTEVTNKALTVDQLITLLNQFLTDDSKLECAEYAFPYTTNYKSFLKIMDLFSQESYKYRLEDYYDKARKM
ncbi:DUF4476 domain-containing protein [Mucilaginibacter ximonensis]|uniref:DUF4476 domain-containing protein n=1 Tax=Mucilaginibacter ximonensis TaxID=538021 RepID=A0ABW5YDD3_9SPHI